MCRSLLLHKQLVAFVKEGAVGDLRGAVLDILASADSNADGSNSTSGISNELVAQLEAAMAAARPAATESDGLDGALAIGKVAARMVNVVVGVAALQLVKTVSGTVLQQVRL